MNYIGNGKCFATTSDTQKGLVWVLLADGLGKCFYGTGLVTCRLVVGLEFKFH